MSSQRRLLLSPSNLNSMILSILPISFSNLVTGKSRELLKATNLLGRLPKPKFSSSETLQTSKELLASNPSAPGAFAALPMRFTILPSWSSNLSGWRLKTRDPKDGPSLAEHSASRKGNPDGERGEGDENLPLNPAASATRFSSTPDSNSVTSSEWEDLSVSPRESQ